MVNFAAQAAAMPDASTPKQAEGWGDCKATYRLFSNPDVTFEAVTAPHCAMSRAVPAGIWLVINDTTEINFKYDRDRGADNFEIYCHLLEQSAGWVIRAAQLKRQVRDDAGRERSLDTVARDAALDGTYELQVQANRDQPARTASMELRYARIVMPRPQTGVSRYVRDRGVTEIAMWVVETREVNPLRGVEPLRWVLLTSEKVSRFGDAWRVIEYYEKRPLIEEYHKSFDSVDLSRLAHALTWLYKALNSRAFHFDLALPILCFGAAFAS